MKVKVEKLDSNRQPLEQTTYFNVSDIKGADDGFLICFLDGRMEVFVEMKENEVWFVENEI